MREPAGSETYDIINMKGEKNYMYGEKALSPRVRDSLYKKILFVRDDFNLISVAGVRVCNIARGI